MAAQKQGLNIVVRSLTPKDLPLGINLLFEERVLRMHRHLTMKIGAFVGCAQKIHSVPP